MLAAISNCSSLALSRHVLHAYIVFSCIYIYVAIFLCNFVCSHAIFAINDLISGQHSKTIVYFLHDKSTKFGTQADDYIAISLVMAHFRSATITHCQYYYQCSKT